MESRVHVLEHIPIKANLSEDEVKQIAWQLYGEKVISVKELNGYDDKNFHIKNEEGNEFIMKFINSIDSNNPEIFEAQSLLLVHLKKNGIPCPMPIKTKSGQYYEKCQLKSGSHIVRALKFMEGIVLAEISWNNNLFYEIGRSAANMDNAMASFQHPAYDNYKSLWMLESVPEILHFLSAVNDSDKQQLITTIVHEFKEKLLLRSKNFQRGLIHGDFNEQNIIVDKTDKGQYEVKAIIDYGDCHIGFYVYELAITMTYMILLAKNIGAGGYVFMGYVSVRPMSKEECSFIKLCIAARLCQSLVMGAYTNQQDPTNTYVLITAVYGWQLLEELWNEDDENLLQLWNIASNNKIT
ncbi:hydroxylysine kinase-like [Diorhabda carinulata]|uniref:hydroxylysine kinase-like n=1 Tax=Diorhabda carinulata TaxID=1163345 RepID=UPI0025A23C0D|nr:hydroxylysine kinase-like [Diorhabda carinulata]XP_057670235.1 hydroxylysine kinase-like [Diorhabda carinulata]